MRFRFIFGGQSQLVIESLFTFLWALFSFRTSLFRKHRIVTTIRLTLSFCVAVAILQSPFDSLAGSNTLQHQPLLAMNGTRFCIVVRTMKYPKCHNKCMDVADVGCEIIFFSFFECMFRHTHTHTF